MKINILQMFAVAALVDADVHKVVNEELLKASSNVDKIADLATLDALELTQNVYSCANALIAEGHDLGDSRMKLREKFAASDLLPLIKVPIH